ncbi:MAG: urease accessory protein UreD [Verrucomicrobiota bacterium]|jgi:urease accessory protein
MINAGMEPAQARLEVNVVSGQSSVTSACASNPLKLLLPRSRGPSVWAYLSSFGGGFVAGDETSLHIRLGPESRCFVTTQALTKIYRNPRLRPCGHRLSASLEQGSLLVLAPEPIQAFADSAYIQRQEFHLRPAAGLVLVDWFCSGRAARGERWTFTRLQSRNEIFLGGERVLLDSLLLDAAPGPLRSAHRMGRFNCLALMAVVGDSLAPHAAQILADVAAQPVVAGAPLLVSASPLRHGVLLRVVGEREEDVGREMRRCLGFVPDLLQDDPWSRKW